MIGHQNDQCILVNIVVECAEQLGQKKRPKTAFGQQAELVFVFHGGAEHSIGCTAYEKGAHNAMFTGSQRLSSGKQAPRAWFLRTALAGVMARRTCHQA